MSQKKRGIETLKKLSKCEDFNKHIYETIKPYTGKKVLEVGAGIGNITRFLINEKEISVCDIDKNAIKILEEKFHSNISIIEWDIEKEPDDELKARFDSVVCLNVLEHIEDDEKALLNLKETLCGDGNLIILVPAHKFLYSPLDENLGHFKRYSKKELKELLEKTGLKIEKIFYFNFLGLFGWLLTGKIFRKGDLPSSQLGIYNILSKIFIPLEKKLPLPTGLSIIAIARK